ncbi:MAG: hypothetical protein CM15mP120_27830 [Pseudomonadota bacterium]|nr:MAG: hypothetical protein CM15mP120_27830 [Pseudomonadota bacterium]
MTNPRIKQRRKTPNLKTHSFGVSKTSTRRRALAVPLQMQGADDNLWFCDQQTSIPNTPDDWENYQLTDGQVRCVSAPLTTMLPELRAF